MVVRRVCKEASGEALRGFSLPPSFPSLLLENHASYCKKTKRVWLFVC